MVLTVILVLSSRVHPIGSLDNTTTPNSFVLIHKVINTIWNGHVFARYSSHGRKYHRPGVDVPRTPSLPLVHRQTLDFLKRWDANRKPIDQRTPPPSLRQPATPEERWGLIPISDNNNNKAQRAFEAPSLPSINDPFVIRRPGEVVDVATVVRNYWAFPLTGFNAKLEIPYYPFELINSQKMRELGLINLPSSIFGTPIRPDVIFLAWQYYVRAYIGWTERMQLFKWEWPGSKKKQRVNNTGYARMNWKKSPARYPGVHTNPIRPRDHRKKITKKTLLFAMKSVLSAKFCQDQLRVVADFNLNSHKTAHCVLHLRRLLGLKARKVLLVHTEHQFDSNDNFRWAVANISGVERQVPKGLTVYNLLRCDKIVFTKAALQELIKSTLDHTTSKKSKVKYATPDGTPAPVPKKVVGWDDNWRANKARDEFLDYKLLQDKLSRHWKWSNALKGPNKVWRNDPFRHWRLKEWSIYEKEAPWQKWEMFNKEAAPLQGIAGTSTPAVVDYVPIFSDDSSNVESTNEVKQLEKDDIIKLKLNRLRY